MSVESAVESQIGKLPGDLQGSGEAAIALAMAARIDSGKGSPSECAKVALDALAKLREMAPPPKEETGLDVIKRDRALRLVGGSAGKD